MAKKLSSNLTAERLNAPSPFAFFDHTHAPDYPPVAADIAARDALTFDQRYEGVIIYVLSDQTTYQLRGGISNTDWIVLVTVTGVASHTELGDIGTNSHVAIDTHIADSTIHFTQAAISITESQISDLGPYSLTSHLHAGVYLPIADASASTNALESLTQTINVSLADEPLIGQVLMATSCDTATWQFVSGSGGTGDIIQTGSPADTFVAYFTADKNLSGDAGMTWITAAARFNIIGTAPVIRLQDSDSTGITMTSVIEFYDNVPGLIGEIGYVSGDLRLKNTAGDIRLDTDGSAIVTISGDGDIAIGGYIDGYADSPSDGDFLTWVTANTRAEFVTPTIISATGTPVDNQIVVFDSVNSVDGDPNFLWDQATFTALDFIYTSVNDQILLGGGDLAVPGISIDGSATASPFINLQQDGVTRASFRFDNADDQLEISSTADDMVLRPGNIDTLTLTAALTTLVSTVFVAEGTVDVGVEILFTEQADHIFTPVATRSILWVLDDAAQLLIFTDDAGIDFILNRVPNNITDADADTRIRVEVSADEDKIRFDTGSNITGFPAQIDTLILSSQEFTLALPTANVATTTGGAISLTAGTGNTTGYGGEIAITSGDGGAGSGSYGGDIVITTGSGSYYGGDIKLNCGDATADDGYGGTIRINAGESTTDYDGGSIRLTAGKGGPTSGEGGVTSMTGGLAGAPDGDGGRSFLTGGAGDGSGSGGNASITGGTGAVTGTPGRAEVTGGQAVSGGVGGQATVRGGNLNVTVGGVAGEVIIQGGQANSVDGIGGRVLIKGGQAVSGAGIGAAVDIEGSAVSSNSPLGGPINITAGAGGTSVVSQGGLIAITSGAGNNTGAGGALNITSGDGGSSDGYGGAINIIGGAGSGGGYNGGGPITLTGGDGDYLGGSIFLNGGDANGYPGGVYMTGGTGSNAGGGFRFTGGQGTNYGGAVTFRGGNSSNFPGKILLDAGNGQAGNAIGGDIDIESGQGFGAGDGGDITLAAGPSGTTGAGGAINFLGGVSGSVTGNGGAIVAKGGRVQAIGVGGAVSLTGGDGGVTSGDGGAITLTGGIAYDGVGGGISMISGSGVGTNQSGGAISITAGNGGATNSNGGDITLTAGDLTGSGISGKITLNVGTIDGIIVTELNNQVLIDFDTQLGVTAFATGGQGSAVQLDAAYNTVTVCATNADSVKLPPIFNVGAVMVIKNDGAADLAIFPASGDDLGAGTDTSVIVTAASNVAAVFLCTVANATWTQIA